MEFKNYRRAVINSLKLNDPVFARAIQQAKDSTIPSALAKCYETGRIDAFKLNYHEGMPNKPHIFWDSDTAKVLEGISNILSLCPDSRLEAEYDKLIDLIAASQQPDGYLNSYYTNIEPENRFTNLMWNHELYCAGHLIEAAVSGYELLGKRKFLDVMCRYADYIDSVFGREEGKKRGYPGHQEIELALIRLYHVTGNEKYFKLAKYFIDERGQQPNYFAEKEGNNPSLMIYFQAHKPVREEETAVGHSVRANYMYAAMTDIAGISKDEELFRTCEKIFKNITERRMYITGGVGSTFQWEAFTIDYDLQNGSLMYAESCAAIALVRFAARMLNLTGDGRYAEIVEKAIYNGVLAGISLSGDEYFYTNYLEVDDNTKIYNSGAKKRQKWFKCSCCPTNFCRFIPEINEYIWSESNDEIRLNIPAANIYHSKFGDIEVFSNYPYDGKIKIAVRSSETFKIAVRIPQWCKNFSVSLNKEKINPEVVANYITFDRTWQYNDCIEYNLEMPVEIMRSNFKVTNNAGRVALMRGPLVYACESIDNPDGIANMKIRTDRKFKLVEMKNFTDSAIAICGSAVHEFAPDDDALYYSGELKYKQSSFYAIPYFLWQNRGESNMAVWLREN